MSVHKHKDTHEVNDLLKLLLPACEIQDKDTTVRVEGRGLSNLWF